VVDGSVGRAHQHAAGVRHGAPTDSSTGVCAAEQGHAARRMALPLSLCLVADC
jgi:hypothetical protein